MKTTIKVVIALAATVIGGSGGASAADIFDSGDSNKATFTVGAAYTF